MVDFYLIKYYERRVKLAFYLFIYLLKEQILLEKASSWEGKRNSWCACMGVSLCLWMWSCLQESMHPPVRAYTLSLLPVCKFTYLHISVSTSKTCTTLHFNLWDKNSPNKQTNQIKISLLCFLFSTETAGNIGSFLSFTTLLKKPLLDFCIKRM